jgi:hypothetical protein
MVAVGMVGDGVAADGVAAVGAGASHPDSRSGSALPPRLTMGTAAPTMDPTPMAATA